ncbi:hypothetical protein [Helicobacter burdigaliensis]|uniref:hypothetical protein n=1 Tax=Helicobacter burdigaliensis TaxID=2315334 RepID=UPI000EF6E46C|nr:hypothetical protein [Helicobacter burdigaliensis]
MALPFIAGLVVGSSIALLYTKRKEVKNFIQEGGVSDSLKKGKDLSINALNSIKEDFLSKEAMDTKKTASKETKVRKKRTPRATKDKV